MSAREDAIELILGRRGRNPEAVRGDVEADLDALEAEGLHLIAKPLPPSAVIVTGPLWRGDGWAVMRRYDGSVIVSVDPGTTPFPPVLTIPPGVASAISAAHLREDSR